MNNNNNQYIIKIVRDNNGDAVYFNFGIDKHREYVNTETSLSEDEYIGITCYNQDEYNDYKEHVKDIMNSKAKLSIII